MPFGLKNAPSVFQRLVMQALGDLTSSYVMDDIMITASTQCEALGRLQIVLNVLTVAGFSFNITKWSFLKTSVQYLGYNVSATEIRPNAQKMVALTALPPPQSVTSLRQFIGFATFFKQFIKEFSQLMKPLYFLTSDKNKFIWKTEHEQIRKKVISTLTDKPVLVIFDPKYPIKLHTDSSCSGYGAILLHKIDGKPQVIEYYSKTTSPAETLAVVKSIKYFRHYLLGRYFTVFTDCNSLKASRNKQDLTPRA